RACGRCARRSRISPTTVTAPDPRTRFSGLRHHTALWQHRLAIGSRECDAVPETNRGRIMAQIIDGKQVAENVVATASDATRGLAAKGVQPGLAVVIVGEDPASQVYVASKSKKAKECGFHSVQHTLAADTPQTDLVALIEKLNADPAIHGILVQLPLPAHIDAGAVIQAIAPDKDVDGFTFINVGRLGTGEVASAFVPCTPAGSMLLVERVRGRDLSGLSAVVVGRSNIVGKPMANLLLAANCTVTVAHS